MTTTQAKVTSNGQVSLPAALRHRWHADTVLVLDRGDYAIVRPVPSDPVSALQGAHAGSGTTTEELRADERAADAASEARRRDER